jgi:hypothetical protein
LRNASETAIGVEGIVCAACNFGDSALIVPPALLSIIARQARVCKAAIDAAKAVPLAGVYSGDPEHQLMQRSVKPSLTAKFLPARNWRSYQ